MTCARSAQVVVLGLVLCGLGCACRTADKAHASRRGPLRAAGEADPLFQHRRVLPIALQLDESDMTTLSRRPYRYVPAKLTVDGTSVGKVGVHFKGHRSLRSWSSKPSLKLHLSKYKKGKQLHGHSRLVLNAMIEDPTAMREVLAYELFRRGGVPAPRTAYARLTVNGRDYGLYLLLEPVRPKALARQVGGGGGVVYEGEFGCDVYPADVARMEKKAGKDPGRRALRRLAEAAEGPIEGLFEGDAPLLDRQRFLAYLGASAAAGDFDGYRHAHNYYLYRNAELERWMLVPWGLDRALERVDMPLYDMEGRLARKCFASRGCRRDYVRAVQDSLKDLAALRPMLDQLYELTREEVARDARFPANRVEYKQAVHELRAFFEERPDYLAEPLSCVRDGKEVDRDGDGHGCMDPDDQDPARHPGAPEVCDGLDNDGSGLADDSPRCPCQEVDAHGTKFYLCNLPMTWHDAEAFCRAQGRHLARFDRKAHTRRVHEAAREVEETEWWIGLQDQREEGTFEWSDGTPARYTRWADEEPDDWECGENCVALRDSDSGKWEDLHCGELHPFVCR